jgi:endothelin-converting enzyme/putative endopeptidase
LTGAIKQRPREDRALQTIMVTLVKLWEIICRKFPAEAKEKAEKMIQNIILAYQNRITNLTLMSAETKTKAIEKLKKSQSK